MFERYVKKKIIQKGIEIEDSIMTATEKEQAIIEIPLERRKAAFVWYAVVLVLGFFLARVFYLDVVKGQYYLSVSKENRIRKIVIKAPRGNIFDKFGRVLAANYPSLDVVMVPKYLPEDPEEKKRMIATLSEVLNMNRGNVEIAFLTQSEKSLDQILIKQNISQDQALILAEKIHELPGIMLEKTAIRDYQSSVIFSHIIGYEGKITREELDHDGDYLMTDYIGKTGIEKSYEAQLRGVNGAQQVEINSRNEIRKNLGVIEPVPGSDLILNIDEDLQKKLYDSLSSVLEKSETRTAAAVAIDPRTGGVLALVSLPSYDNGVFARGITNDEYKTLISNPDLPLLNRAVSGAYPPGSTLKPAVAAAALTEKTITAETTVDCNGALHVGSWRFGDWNVHGVTDVRKAIAESCDVFFYSVGGGYGHIEGLGMDKMKEYVNLFGFGVQTGIDLPSESSGFIPDKEWKLKKLGERWYVGNDYHASIGQGYITTTPLQLANYTAALANGGTLFSPKIVNRIKKNNQEEIFVQPEIIRRNFISPEVLRIVREGMRQTVTSGTAQSLSALPVEAAGKTGTAQFGSEDKTHAWFVSFAPFDNPQIAMAVLVEGGGEGHSSAVPVTKEIYQWYFEHKGLVSEQK